MDPSARPQLPHVLLPGGQVHDGQALCPYADALALMEALVERPPTAPDVVLCLQHPPTLTVGRRGGREHVHTTRLALPGHPALDVDVHETARGGSVTWHAPGQLVVYPVVQLPRLAGALGRGPLGDLPAFARALEDAMQAACAAFGLATSTRPGFAGLWLDERTKIGSLGVAVRRGWTYHGLALNVCPHLEAFDLVTPCGLEGVKMTSLWRELEQQGLPRPTLGEVRDELLAVLLPRLRRRQSTVGSRPADT